jgi:cell division protein FtsZ
MPTHSNTIQELKPRIVVFGVGGAGGNAVNNMIDAELKGVEFVVANTDAQALALSKAQHRIQLGLQTTEGLGAGARPEIGMAAAEESLDEINAHLSGAHLVFIAAGMGGGTGTGAAPVIARTARERGILTIGVVTKPFQFEGQRRMLVAEQGIMELEKHVDTLIVVPNQNLFRLADEKTTFAKAFSMADQVLYAGVRGVTDLMVMPGLINLDFADVRTVMAEMGKAMMGSGEGKGTHRAIEAAQGAITNPLLDDASMKGARGVLINITGGFDMTLYEVDEAANFIRSEVDPHANIILGSTFDERMEGRMRVSVVATGITREAIHQAPPGPVQAPVRRPASADPNDVASSALQRVASVMRDADEADALIRQTQVPSERASWPGSNGESRSSIITSPPDLLAPRAGASPSRDPFDPREAGRPTRNLFGWRRERPEPSRETPSRTGGALAADDGLEIPEFLRRQMR